MQEESEPTTSVLADFSQLGALAELLDVSRAPLLWPSASSSSFSSTHAREADFSGFLYAEGDKLFLADAEGPVCLSRAHFIVTPTHGNKPMPWGGEIDALDINLSTMMFTVEIDGVIALEETATSLFRGGFIFWPHAFLPSTETLSGGASMLAPLCAQERLRVSVSLGGAGGLSGAQLLAASDYCLETNSLCLILMYWDINFVRPLSMPKNWLSISTSSLTSPLLSERALKASHIEGGPDAATSAPRLLAAIAARAKASASSSTCALLNEAAPLSIFSATGEGTVLSIELSFEDAAAARSRSITLVALWDGGKGRLEFDLEALFGPAELGSQGIPGPSPALPSAQLWLGVIEVEGIKNVTMAYLTLPAPYWESAHIELRLASDATTPVYVCATVRAAAGSGCGPLRGAASGMAAASGGGGTAAAAGFYERGAAGYLQSAVHDVTLRKLDRVPLFEVEGLSGRVVVLTTYFRLMGGNFPFSAFEGDIITWADNASSPIDWATGFEDYFNGAHGYDFSTARLKEPFFMHHRKNTWPRGFGTHPNIDVFTMRLMSLDAPVFRHSLLIELEGFPGDYDNATSRGAVLYYGNPTLIKPSITDRVFSAREWYHGGKHGYRLNGPPPEVYNDSSVFAGRGEPTLINGVCPPRTFNFRDTHYIVHCPVRRISFQVLALQRDARVHFSVAVDPRAASVALRRTFDVRHSVQRAELWVDNVRVGLLQSAGRAFSYIDTHWREVDVQLPPTLTAGKNTLQIQVRVLGNVLAAGANRTYPAVQFGDSWTEIEWAAVCFFS